MKIVTFLMFMCMSMSLMSVTSCDDHVTNIPVYVDAAGKAYTIAEDGTKEYEEAKTKIEKAQAAVKAIGNTARVVTAVVPGTQPIGTVVVAICGVVSTILGIFAIKKTKELRIEKAKVKDWNDAVESAIAKGDNQTVANVEVLKDVLDTETKSDFNKLGVARL